MVSGTAAPIVRPGNAPLIERVLDPFHRFFAKATAGALVDADSTP